MVEHGVVSQAAADRAWRQPLEPTGWQVRYDKNRQHHRATQTYRGAAARLEHRRV